MVPSVRGPSRSLPEKEVKNRLLVLVQSGYSEVVLTGIHLGAYGLDLNPSSNITGLLRSVEKDDRLNHSGVRLSSLEPTEFSDELIEYISKSKIVCHHAHIPLQSGDQQILQKMGRGYTPDFFKDRIQHLVSRIRNVNIGIDVIAGFPGETDEQFHKTVAFIRKLPVGYLHVFPYSPRPGTAAASYPDHVPETIRKKRAAVLRQLSSQKKHDFYSSFINRDLPVIVEGTIDKETGLQKGLSGNYIPLLIDGEHECRGKRVMVRITDVHDTRVFGNVV